MARKFVVTGGPGNGKTSVIEKLSKDFIVFPEVAREILKNKEYCLDVQYEIFVGQVKQNKESNLVDGNVFFDRGIPDSLAYFRYNQFVILEELLINSSQKNTNYEGVFVLDLIPYVKDRIRIESNEEARRIHYILHETYKYLGYQIIKVPFMSIEERVDFILDKII